MFLQVHRILECTRMVGPGLRFSIWVQGCSHGCRGCSATATWPHKKGHSVDISALTEKIISSPDIEGVTFIGGEPFEQAEALSQIARMVHFAGLSVVIFTGFTYAELLDAGKDDQIELLKYTDLLIDGPFIEEQKSLARPWVGSDNQNYIFLTERYGMQDIIAHSPAHEFHVKSNGQIISNGITISIENLERLFRSHSKI